MRNVEEDCQLPEFDFRRMNCGELRCFSNSKEDTILSPWDAEPPNCYDLGLGVGCNDPVAELEINGED